MHWPTTDTPKASAVLNVAEKFSHNSDAFKAKYTQIKPVVTGQAELLLKNFHPLLATFVNPLKFLNIPRYGAARSLAWLSLGPSVGRWKCRGSELFSRAPRDASEFSSPVVFGLCKEKLFLFPSHNKKEGNRNINVFFSAWWLKSNLALFLSRLLSLTLSWM